MKVKIDFDNNPDTSFYMTNDLAAEGIEVEVQDGFYWLYKHILAEMTFIQEKLEEIFNTTLKKK